MNSSSQADEEIIPFTYKPNLLSGLLNIDSSCIKNIEQDQNTWHTFLPIPGVPHPLKICFPKGKLPVCTKCKGQFKTRKYCREDPHKHSSLPWCTSFICLTFDDSCFEYHDNENDNENESNDEGPPTQRRLKLKSGNTIRFTTKRANEWRPYKIKENSKTMTIMKDNECSSSRKNASIHALPMCFDCKKKRYTGTYCRGKRTPHFYLPWSTVYVDVYCVDNTEEGETKKKVKSDPDMADKSSKKDDDSDYIEHESDSEFESVRKVNRKTTTTSTTTTTVKDSNNANHNSAEIEGERGSEGINIFEKIDKSRTLFMQVSADVCLAEWLDYEETRVSLVVDQHQSERQPGGKSNSRSNKQQRKNFDLSNNNNNNKRSKHDDDTDEIAHDDLTRNSSLNLRRNPYQTGHVPHHSPILNSSSPHPYHNHLHYFNQYPYSSAALSSHHHHPANPYSTLSSSTSYSGYELNPEHIFSATRGYHPSHHHASSSLYHENTSDQPSSQLPYSTTSSSSSHNYHHHNPHHESSWPTQQDYHYYQSTLPHHRSTSSPYISDIQQYNNNHHGYNIDHTNYDRNSLLHSPPSHQQHGRRAPSSADDNENKYDSMEPYNEEKRARGVRNSSADSASSGTTRLPQQEEQKQSSHNNFLYNYHNNNNNNNEEGYHDTTSMRGYHRTDTNNIHNQSRTHQQGDNNNKQQHQSSHNNTNNNELAPPNSMTTRAEKTNNNSASSSSSHYRFEDVHQYHRYPNNDHYYGASSRTAREEEEHPDRQSYEENNNNSGKRKRDDHHQDDYGDLSRTFQP